MSTFRISKAVLDSLDMGAERFTRNGRLSVTAEEINNHSSLTCFPQPAGENHYRLLAYLSHQFNGAQLVDVGTYQGMSALALASNPANAVISYDIVDGLTRDFSDLGNVTFVFGDILKAHPEAVRQTPLIFYDTSPHGGVDECLFYRHMGAVDFQGIAIFDDIHFNAGMEDFWAKISHPKLDLTPIGHNTGTGAVFFGEDRIEIC